MKDLTKGLPVKVIVMFALPILFGNIFQQLYNIADSKIVSTYVSTNAFAAVGATSVISNTIISFINGLTQGFAIPVANSFGAKDYRKMRKYIAGAIFLTLGATVVFTALALCFIEKILKLLSTPDDIYADALTYVRIIIVGIIFTAIYNLCANVLRAVGDSKTPLYCLMAAVVVNIGLDLLFVKGMGLNIAGAAYATVIAQAMAGLMCLIYIFVKFRDIIPKHDDWKLYEGQYSNLISTGLSMALMSCIVNIGSVILQSAINGLGTTIVTAHTAARRVFEILTVTIFSLSVAVTTYTSQNIGAGKPKRVVQGVRQVLILEVVLVSFLILLCYLFAEPMYHWILSSDNMEIISVSVRYSKISILFFYVLGPLLVLRCSMQGMGRKVLPVITSVLEMTIKILSAKLLVPALGYTGVIFTEPISWIAMLIVLAIGYIGATGKFQSE